MESAIHMNGASPFTRIEPFMTNTNAFTMPTHLSGCPPIKRVETEMEQDCPAWAGDSYSIELESMVWCWDSGQAQSFDARLQAYCRSEQDRDLLVVFLEDAIQRYCQVIVERLQHEGSTTIPAVA